MDTIKLIKNKDNKGKNEKHHWKLDRINKKE